MFEDFDILLLDNYDSFTYNLYDYWLRLGVSCRVIRNDELSFDEFKTLNFKALVISPGPQKPKDAGLLMPMIEHFYTKKPIFGICLGHQGIGEFFGATLLKNKIPVHGKTSKIQHNKHALFQDLPNEFEVMRYHSLVLQDFENTDLEVIASTNENDVMAIAHKHLPIHGVQFHPESILTEFGLEMMENWLKIIKLK